MTSIPASGLRHLAMPVVVVAAEAEGRRSCSTSTAMYASLDPPLLVISLASHSTTLRTVLAARRFSISLLSSEQAEVAVAAGGRAQGPDKFGSLGIAADEPDDGFPAPAVVGAAAAWCCRIRDELDAGDHVVVVGQIEAVRARVQAAAPLLRHFQRYRVPGAPTAVQDSGGYPL